MTIWALADLHLSFGVPNKEMDIFGEKWRGHPDKIKQHWLQEVDADDLVLLPGDISWAMSAEEAKPDLDWIDALPGTKVMLRGNHDYWWTSPSKIAKILPPSIRYIQNNIFKWKGVAIAGSRLWDTPEYAFQQFIEYADNPRANKLLQASHTPEESERIFTRELQRLEISLKAIPQDCNKRIAMTHYPPIGADLTASRASALLKKYGISVCVFGHLHNVKKNLPMFGTKKEGITYTLVACDYVDFTPVKIAP